MGHLIRGTVLTVLAILVTVPAVAQPVEPGQEGALATFVKPETGARACFERVYGAEHLARHPSQTVMSMRFRIAYHRFEPDDVYPQGQRNYYFQMSVGLRDDGRTLVTGGECTPATSDQIACNVECDGGGVLVRHAAAKGIVVDLAATGRIRLAECEGDEENAIDLEPGADDRTFLLRPTSDCPPLEEW